MPIIGIVESNRRLTVLAAKLRTVKPERFDYQTYANASEFSEENCGTSGCAAGWACLIPEFQNLGLSLDLCYISPAFGYKRGFEALEEFFGLDIMESGHLFFPAPGEPKHDPVYVADKIDAFVASREVKA